ncbi:hypothetical protein BGLT_05371 [Caballeronia glathei]|jgi:hypothetical protein|uniref:hypothetical protein n=1 Tax=Caballeronia glathei TaxID=60547 RepID=UPI0004FFE592|nr:MULTISPECIES: hypothetical protein [Burkholderiaceae]TCK38997.1 hypothetical protein B0G84_4325 [Paraburkholderia sp. BL8N3]CDY76297.1 hypothetical protein BGLT_05371 [Caballeronia glathei]
MYENTPLEQFSALDDWAPAAPIWRPFVPQSASTPRAQRTHEAETAEVAWER